MLKLENRVAVITGGAQGIGLAMAERLTGQGANVVIADLNGEKASESAAKVTALGGGKCIGVTCNVGDLESIKSAMKAAADEFGGIDILVNNAGILHATPIEDITVEEFDRQLMINLRAPFFVTQQALPYLKKSKAGRVINMSSVAGRMGSYASGMGYVAGKGGLIALTYGMARQYAAMGITINCICPGTVGTDMIKEWSDEQVQGLIDKIPAGRLGRPDEIASCVAYLASDEAAFVTGHAMDINGGMFIG